MKKLNITKDAFEKSNYFKNKYGELEYVSESGKLFKTNKGKVLMFKEAKRLEWLNSFKKAQDFVDKACEQLEIAAFEGGADVGNTIHKRLLSIWGEMRDVVVKTTHKDSGAIKESTKKFGRKSVKESFDDMEKEFTYKGVTITRYDYESLPSPMAASKLDDKTMQRIAYDIYDYLTSAGWEDDEIAKYLGPNLDEVLDDDWKGEQIKDEFWQYMEKAALDNGMEYYEDMPEDEM